VGVGPSLSSRLVFQPSRPPRLGGGFGRTRTVGRRAGAARVVGLADVGRAIPAVGLGGVGRAPPILALADVGRAPPVLGFTGVGRVRPVVGLGGVRRAPPVVDLGGVARVPPVVGLGAVGRAPLVLGLRREALGRDEDAVGREARVGERCNVGVLRGAVTPACVCVPRGATTRAEEPDLVGMRLVLVRASLRGDALLPWGTVRRVSVTGRRRCRVGRALAAGRRGRRSRSRGAPTRLRRPRCTRHVPFLDL
jgi:hypothetical protein